MHPPQALELLPQNYPGRLAPFVAHSTSRGEGRSREGVPAHIQLPCSNLLLAEALCSGTETSVMQASNGGEVYLDW